MNKIRQLTNEEKPFIFIRELTQICSHNGVAVVFVPPLKRTGVFGATRWIGDKAVIMLSLRYKTNDHLWFTFFHEAGHIVKHGKSDIFIDIKDQDENGKEEEANSFAQNQLIPQIEFRQFIGSGVYSREKIIEFSRKIGIAPGIVVGRLQREDRVQWNSTLNKLKVHYKWAI